MKCERDDELEFQMLWLRLNQLEQVQTPTNRTAIKKKSAKQGAAARQLRRC